MNQLPTEVIKLIVDLLVDTYDEYMCGRLLQVSTVFYTITRAIIRVKFEHLKTTSNQLLMSMFPDTTHVSMHDTKITMNTITQLTNLRSLVAEKYSIQIPKTLTSLRVIGSWNQGIADHHNLISLHVNDHCDSLLNLTNLQCLRSYNMPQVNMNTLTSLDIDEMFHDVNMLTSMRLIKLSIHTSKQLPVLPHLTKLTWIHDGSVSVRQPLLRCLVLIVEGVKEIDAPLLRKLYVSSTDVVPDISRFTQLETLHWYSAEKPQPLSMYTTYEGYNKDGDEFVGYTTVLANQRDLKLERAFLSSNLGHITKLNISNCVVKKDAIASLTGLTKLRSVVCTYDYSLAGLTSLLSLYTLGDVHGAKVYTSIPFMTNLTSLKADFDYTPVRRMNIQKI